MKRNRVILWLIAPLMLIGVILTAYLQPTIICAFQGGDVVEETACVTAIRLRHYEQRPQETLAWLFARHGEETDAEVMYSLADWALQEPDRFLDLLSKIDETKLEPSLSRVAAGINGNLQEAEFKALFTPRIDESERLCALLELIK